VVDNSCCMLFSDIFDGRDWSKYSLVIRCWLEERLRELLDHPEILAPMDILVLLVEGPMQIS
jgi:hypothetical protein